MVTSKPQKSSFRAFAISFPKCVCNFEVAYNLLMHIFACIDKKLNGNRSTLFPVISAQKHARERWQHTEIEISVSAYLVYETWRFAISRFFIQVNNTVQVCTDNTLNLFIICIWFMFLNLLPLSKWMSIYCMFITMQVVILLSLEIIYNHIHHVFYQTKQSIIELKCKLWTLGYYHTNTILQHNEHFLNF